MAGVGGYQPPANPAPVSGPGALSQRTDGGTPTQGAAQLPNARYGEQRDFQAQQRGAPMAGGGGDLTPLDAPTARPGEPVTAGNPMGPGATSLPSESAATQDDLLRAKEILPALTLLASHETSSPALRQLVRQLQVTVLLRNSNNQEECAQDVDDQFQWTLKFVHTVARILDNNKNNN